MTRCNARRNVPVVGCFPIALGVILVLTAVTCGVCGSVSSDCRMETRHDVQIRIPQQAPSAKPAAQPQSSAQPEQSVAPPVAGAPPPAFPPPPIAP